MLVGIAALYYWSLYGAWYIVIDKTGGFSGKNYQYLEGKMFPIALDRDYLIDAGLVRGVHHPGGADAAGGGGAGGRAARSPRRLLLRHGPILLIGLVAGVAQLLAGRGQTRRGVDPECVGLYVHAIANR